MSGVHVGNYILTNYVTACQYVTDAVLFALGTHCASHLHILFLTDCAQVTDAGVYQVS